MKAFIEKYIPKEYRFYIILYLVFLAVHLVLPLNWGDDKIFLSKSADAGLFDFLQGSARPFTDGLTYIFSRFHFLWRILNPAVLTVLVWVIPKILPSDNVHKALPILAVYPTMCMVDAGFVATTVNYLWPVTFGIISLLPLKNLIYGKRTKLSVRLLVLPLMLYATNMQQMAVVMLVALLAGNVYLLSKRTVNFYLIFQNIIVAGMTAYSYYINTVGENNRMVRETGRYFPEFLSLNIFEKLELGFSSTFYGLTSQIYFTLAGSLAFMIFLCVMSFKQSTKLRLLSLLPPALSGVLCFISPYIFGELKNYKMQKAVYSFEPVADIIFIIIGVLVVISILSLVKSNGNKIYCMSVLVLGLGSRMMMGFSPTVWASGCRTFCIMLISFILITLVIVEEKNRNETSVYMPS
ncbi:MAG: hypothetical protein IJZ57_00265 [Clostridia bacterium]|nr:hypothetical protein [Clostridia bacterium]